MADSFILVGKGGADTWRETISTVGALPATGVLGQVRLALDTGTVYYWNGSAWTAIAAGAGFITAISDTNSINLTESSGTLSADLLISANAATANFQKVVNTIDAGGLHGEVPIATGSQIGLHRSATTNSISASYSSGVADHDLRLSTNSASSNFQLVVNTIQSSGVVGLHSEVPIATGTQIGLHRILTNSSFTGTYSAGVWDGSVRLSSNAADAGFLKVPINLESTSSVGLRAQVREASTSQSGVLDSTLTDALDGVTDGTAAAAGKVGEVLSTETALAAGPATGVTGSATSVSLTAGRWVVTGHLLYNDNGADVQGPIETGIDDNATGTNLDTFDTIKVESMVPVASVTRSVVVPEKVISISSTTTYHLTVQSTFVTATPTVGGRIQARRI